MNSLHYRLILIVIHLTIITINWFRKKLNQFAIVITPDGNIRLNPENKIVHFKSGYKKRENKCDVKNLCG